MNKFNFDTSTIKGILFLDIDGVLTSDYLDKLQTKEHLFYKDGKKGPIMFHIEIINVLKTIIKKYSLGIVIISDWKKTHSLDELRYIFSPYISNFDNPEINILDVTENLNNRNLEIKRWMETNVHEFNIDKNDYIIFDDINFYNNKNQKHLVHVEKFTGISRYFTSFTERVERTTFIRNFK